SASTSRLKRAELQRASSSVPGRDIVQVQTEIPAGVASGWRTHPGEEIGYTVAGKVDMKITGRSPLQEHVSRNGLLEQHSGCVALRRGRGEQCAQRGPSWRLCGGCLARSVVLVQRGGLSPRPMRSRVPTRPLLQKEAPVTDATMTKQIVLTRRSPAYWRVTFDHPPLNIFGPETLPQLNEVVTALETDEEVKVVVFDSAVDGFFLTHYNFVAKLEESTRLPP